LSIKVKSQWWFSTDSSRTLLKKAKAGDFRVQDDLWQRRWLSTYEKKKSILLKTL
jgi:hypothetical protein